MKKRICFPIVLFVLFALVTGCMEEALPQKIRTVTLSYWTYDEMYKDYMEKCVNVYNTRTETKIQLKTAIYSADELDYKLWSSLQSGVGTPDLVDLEQSRFGRYMNPKNNYLTPLNSVLTPKIEQLDNRSYSKYKSKGFYYGIDYYANNCVVFYNMDLLKAAEIDPAGIKTFDDYLMAGKKLKENIDMPMIAVDYTDDVLFEILLTAAGSGYCASDGSLQINSETNTGILQLLYDMIHTSKIAVNAPTGEYFSYEFLNYFNNGKVASIIAPFWYAGYIEKYMPALKGKIHVAGLPAWGQKYNSGVRISGVATAVPIQSENPIIAKNLLRDTRLSLENCLAGFEDLFADPIVPATYKDERLPDLARQKQLFANNCWSVLKEEYTGAKTPVLGPSYYNAVNKITSGALFQVLKENTLSPKDALTQAQDEIIKEDNPL